jgi:hypothetical protein
METKLRARRPRVRVRFPIGESDFSVLHNVQTGSGAHPASYTAGTGAVSPGIKRQGREADHSVPSRSKIKNSGAIPPLPRTSSWHGI